MPKKVTKTAAKTKAVEGFALDQGKSLASGVDPKVAENKRKEQELQKALIGYAKWDFLAHPAKFGTWNMRALNTSEVQKILDGFGVVGCNRFSKEHLIPLVVKKEYIKEYTYDQEFPDETDLRPLKLDTKVPISYLVAAASGQHRVAALKRWVQNQTAKLKNLEKEARRVKQAASDEHGDQDVAYYNDTVKPQLDNVKAILNNHGYWGVAIYDVDLASVESLTYLSTNQRIHVYKETPEEGLIQKYREMMSPMNPAKRKPEASFVTKGSVFKQWELLTQDYVTKLLGYLLDLGPHFVHSKSFKLSHFHEDMMSSYGGILAYISIRAIERLRRT
ncbi:hypothetical protein L210DRAFT_3657807 [Boletus edulis BED1]|uniref:Uncharacterized protein n=1 Tax=Boletus edulis BED1 TaxID=1328754 RepID=A0AAD4BB13_BOLED|nr:hypothetical protein L210DRAFT_3657807 [Boletus edulis BED1]